jgi:Holliday junction resolvase
VKAAGRRRKGCAGERELAAYLTDRGVPARRVPLSGAMKATGFAGDVLAKLDGPDGGETALEVKRRANGIKTVEGWLRDCPIVAWRPDRGEWFVAMRLDQFLHFQNRHENAPVSALAARGEAIGADPTGSLPRKAIGPRKRI